MAVLGIDASNIVYGGGLNHLRSILDSDYFLNSGFSKAYIWAPYSTLNLLPDKPWLKKIPLKSFSKNLIIRTIWQIFFLPLSIHKLNIDIMYCPGGINLQFFCPSVLFIQNVLPFKDFLFTSNPISLFALKNLLLRYFYIFSIRLSRLVIVPSRSTYLDILDYTVLQQGKVKIIPHGYNICFQLPFRSARSIESCSFDNPFRIVYLSAIDVYKNHDFVIECISRLRLSNNLPLELLLVGPTNKRCMKTFSAALHAYDPNCEWIRYLNEIPNESVPLLLADCDLALWCSSAESFGIVLLEYMAASLPILASDLLVNREILSEDGVFYIPNDVHSFCHQINSLIMNRSQRMSLSNRLSLRSKRFSWSQTSDSTFKTLFSVYTSL